MYFIILRLFGFGIITLVVIGWFECSTVSVGCRGFDLGLLSVSFGGLLAVMFVGLMLFQLCLVLVCFVCDLCCLVCLSVGFTSGLIADMLPLGFDCLGFVVWFS